jgi:2-methylcitrate dehydratase MmgE/PrpD-like protein
VECLPDPNADYPHSFPGRLRLTLRDGRVLERDEPLNRGCAERPLSDDDVAAKFRRNAARALPDAQVEALLGAVQGIDAAASVRELASRCRVDE